MNQETTLYSLIELLHQQDAQKRLWRRELAYLSSVSLLEKAGRIDLVGDTDPLVLKTFCSELHNILIVPGESSPLREIIELLKNTDVEPVEAGAVRENMQYGAEIWNRSAQLVAGFYMGPDVKHGFLYGHGGDYTYNPVRWKGALPEWLDSYWRQHGRQYAP